MRRLLRWLGRLAALLALAVIGLLLPVGYVEVMCRPQGEPETRAPLIAAEWVRPAGRTLMTYPEWHIVHAYDDYAEVIRQGDPHDFGYLKAVGGFWGALCPLAQASGAYGGFDWETRQMIYTIGVSFTAELLLKAAYEETLGRAVTWIRGPERAALDDLSARQAADYARFLQQVPWYRWDFARDRAELSAAATGSFRDTERRLALGAEMRAKGAYAGLIAAAVAGMEPDALTMRVIVTGLPAEVLAATEGVQVIATRPEGIEVETPRYRAFTGLARGWAAAGAEFVEIAGNEDILFSLISDSPQEEGALYSAARQGHGGYRHLMLVRVDDLAGALRRHGAAVEHIHDY